MVGRLMIFAFDKGKGEGQMINVRAFYTSLLQFMFAYQANYASSSGDSNNPRLKRLTENQAQSLNLTREEDSE